MKKKWTTNSSRSDRLAAIIQKPGRRLMAYSVSAFIVALAALHMQAAAPPPVNAKQALGNAVSGHG
jgi:hypothetical protein